jgi:hypothetical protein
MNKRDQTYTLTCNTCHETREVNYVTYREAVRGISKGICRPCYMKRLKVDPPRKTHGASKRDRKLYECWNGMMQRCYNPKHRQFKDWGGRGITVCDEWANDPNAFIDWALGEGDFELGLWLERRDNDGNYCPENCCFVTQTEQNRNQRKTRHITYKGRTMTMRQWSLKLGLSAAGVKNRLRMGWSVERALTTPKRKSNG